MSAAVAALALRAAQSRSAWIEGLDSIMRRLFKPGTDIRGRFNGLTVRYLDPPP